jgi:alcohol dehydrogenase
LQISDWKITNKKRQKRFNRMEEWKFYMPTKIRFGWGRFQEIRQVVDELKGKKIFLVTSKHFAKKYGILDKLSDFLKGLTLVVFAEVEENPTIETVDRGAAQCREGKCDLVMGLGGGSALDAGKAMAMLQKNPGSIQEYLDQERTCQVKGLPYVAIPTTSGTGSEVTPFTVITHPTKKAKPAIAPPENFPDVALVDPELTLSMPFEVTASTGLDALCQAVEGFWSTQGNPLTRSLAFQGIKLAMENLESACVKKDRESVINMALSSHLTGIEMSNIGNTSIHPLSYPITLDYGVPHGFACAIFLPEVIRFNASAIKDRFRDLLPLLNLTSVEAFADKLDFLMEKLRAPRRLGMLGVTAEEIPGIAKRGIGRSTAWNPRPMTEEDIIRICKTIL